MRGNARTSAQNLIRVSVGSISGPVTVHLMPFAIFYLETRDLRYVICEAGWIRFGSTMRWS